MKQLIFPAFVILLAFGCGGGSTTQSGIYPVIVEPNPATISGGVCSSTIKVTGDSEYSVTLMTSQITVANTDGSILATYNDNDILTLFGAVYLPKSGYLEGIFSVDGAARGASGAFNVTYILFGAASNGYPRNWIGFLECSL
jgi:hypothetical protein